MQKRMLSGIAIAIATLVALAAIAFLAFGADRIWRLAGPPDLGDVDFATLVRRKTPNDALACPVDLCRAKTDLVSPVYGVEAPALRQALEQAVAAEPRLLKVAADDVALTDRWIQRSALLGFPDTIVAHALPAGPGHSTIALYSRSQLGAGDLGVNRARIERWLRLLAQRVPLAG